MIEAKHSYVVWVVGVSEAFYHFIAGYDDLFFHCTGHMECLIAILVIALKLKAFVSFISAVHARLRFVSVLDVTLGITFDDNLLAEILVEKIGIP
jgi:hypothetical protein